MLPATFAPLFSTLTQFQSQLWAWNRYVRSHNLLWLISNNWNFTHVLSTLTLSDVYTIVGNICLTKRWEGNCIKTFSYFQKELYYRIFISFSYFQKELYYRSEGFVHTIRWSEGIIPNELLIISEGIILYIRRNYT